jgi:5'-deoxynucleotidase YfbR-like HD superfamily hydrolase
MSFKVKTISVFERQAKRLIKKFPSLKKELQTLISELKEDPAKELQLVIIATKYALPLPAKGEANPVGQELLLISSTIMTRFIS